MSVPVIYMPIFRLRSQEKNVLLSRVFEKCIYPLVEIIKYAESKSHSLKFGRKGAATKGILTFEQEYVPILMAIKSEKVFVDLPVHITTANKMKSKVLKFLKEVVEDRELRTKYMIKLAGFSNKFIPVISTYWQIKNEPNSILLQEKDLRKPFKYLAFRTFPLTFNQDIKQIKKVANKGDYVIYDLGNTEISVDDPDVLKPELDQLRKEIGCEVIIVKNIIPNEIKNYKIVHGMKIERISSDLLNQYKKLFGSGFGDYVGIKKEDLVDGGSVSPGFYFYDPVENSYYGYRGNRYRINGKVTGKLEDFEEIIIPDVMKSGAVRRMRASGLPYLAEMNTGWEMIKKMKSGIENPKSQGKFKRISMEHYLHCIITQINAGLI